MKEKKMPVTHIGTSLILVVLIILTLVTFAVLSVVQTDKDRQFGEKTAGQTQQYYEASNKAEDMLDKIDSVLLKCFGNNNGDFYDAAKSALSGIDGVTADFTGQIPIITFTINYEGNRALNVCLELNYPQTESEGFYRITAWQEVSTKEWHGDNSINILK